MRAGGPLLAASGARLLWDHLKPHGPCRRNGRGRTRQAPAAARPLPPVPPRPAGWAVATDRSCFAPVRCHFEDLHARAGLQAEGDGAPQRGQEPTQLGGKEARSSLINGGWYKLAVWPEEENSPTSNGCSWSRFCRNYPGAAMDAGVLGVASARCSTASCGFCAPVHAGRICLAASRCTKPANGVTKVGCAPGRCVTS